MPFIVKLPKLSPTMEEGTIAKWHKAIGDLVKEGDLLIEVATDKATVEYNALDEGYLRKILIQNGGEAKVNQPIAIFTVDPKESIENVLVEEPKKELSKPAVGAEKQDVAEEVLRPAEVKTGMAMPRFEPEKALEQYEFPFSTEEVDRLRASPLARKLAKDKGLDISSVKGTGPGGRVVKKDLDKALPAGDFSFGPKRQATLKPGSYEEIALTPMRKTIARRLQESKTFIPHIYVQQEVDVDALTAFRDQLRNLNLKVSFNDCVVRAAALALKKHPEVNSGFNSVSNSIIRFKTIDIAIAVSMESGLITPIVRLADQKNIGQISKEISELAKRARAGKLEEHEYKGGSFTVSNLGMYGVSSFAAIINPPQGAILAVSGIKERPVIKQGAIVAGKTMMLTISTDHRVIDGVPAAEFLNTMKLYLENPASLIL
ncbi:pyruvate dehydrogenase complex dihydrolipoamide acetyltransferase [Estrella lausannensis]|uniref:Acetyltransferase component of pyruvate dehydrogenase complex n=1 Tax=Estrella lausannensis TaxID=483423 RepID=A0A0H5DRQ4_9BACT|nr:pyruvate dehydrogenase complex dihydrolipoamide acetyltransferase [Estrella lausannensis]CRX39391.1 branched-chain alpha-keto acid dehydrogenase subunit E2 [Estrella lausannensis]